MTKTNYNIFIKYLFKNFKIKIIKIFLLSILETILEIFSIIILISVLTALLTKNTSFDWIYNFVGAIEYDSDNKINLFYLIILIFVIKNIGLSFIQWIKLNLCGKIFKSISESTYRAILKKNDLFFNNFSPGDLAQNVVEESDFTKNVIISFVSIFTELLIIITLFLIISFQNINASLITILFLTISSSIYYFFMKKKNIELGEKRQIFSIKIMNLLFHSLALHKLIVLADKFNFFIQRFSNKIKTIYKVSRDQIVIQYSARLWLECSVLIILIFTLTPLIKDENISPNKITDILLISIISLRFVPSFSNILSSYSNTQYGVKAVSNIMNILHNFQIEKIRRLDKIQFNDLTIKCLHYKYEVNREFTIENLNIILKNKSLVGVKGDNGSGKSTLLKIIAGLIKPSDGQLKINEKSIYDDEILFHNWKLNVGYADQKLIFSNEAVSKIVAFGENEQDINYNQVADCLRKVDLFNFFMNKPDKLHMMIGENGLKLSGGQLQKLNIARALYRKPKILILDEVTNNLDIKSQENFLQLIKLIKINTLVILATHSKNILDNCDTIIEL